MTGVVKIPWREQKEGFQEALDYLEGRMKGEITSLRTPWPKFNDAGTAGIEWNTTTVIGGRPASGKTLMKDQIIRESFNLNPDSKHRVLEFQFEMLGRASAIREYVNKTGIEYKDLCSANSPISKKILEDCFKYSVERLKFPIDVVEEPCTVEEFKKIIIQYMEHHSYVSKVIVTAKDGTESVVDKKMYTKTVITLDHTILLKRATSEKDKMDMLYSLGEALTSLKRKYPIAFIILSQLNRDIDKPERCEDGRYGNYVLESDFFGADAMLQHADMLIGLNRPAKQKIRYYGPDKYIINSLDVLAVHFIKVRNGEPRLSFFKSEFGIMQISEMATPATQERRISTKLS